MCVWCEHGFFSRYAGMGWDGYESNSYGNKNYDGEAGNSAHCAVKDIPFFSEHLHLLKQV